MVQRTVRECTSNGGRKYFLIHRHDEETLMDDLYVAIDGEDRKYLHILSHPDYDYMPVRRLKRLKTQTVGNHHYRELIWEEIDNRDVEPLGSIDFNSIKHYLVSMPYSPKYNPHIPLQSDLLPIPAEALLTMERKENAGLRDELDAAVANARQHKKEVDALQARIDILEGQFAKSDRKIINREAQVLLKADEIRRNLNRQATEARKLASQKTKDLSRMAARVVALERENAGLRAQIRQILTKRGEEEI